MPREPRTGPDRLASMAAMSCPYCRVLANFTQRHLFQHEFRGTLTNFYVWLATRVVGRSSE
jgi:hypothetical protein